jgi:outer membrane protein assembly factor BamE (lipoprotein component of BamABCDE complex)
MKLAWVVAAALLAACSIQRAETAATAKQSMVGMGREQVLACMGPPAQTAAVGATEVWSYPSGGDTKTFSNGTAVASGNTAYAWGSSSTQNRYCIVNVAFNGSIVSTVNYSGRTGGVVTGDEQCAFAVQNCVH